MYSHIKGLGEIDISEITKANNGAVPCNVFSRYTDECTLLPGGFATTAYAFEEFLTFNSLHSILNNLMLQMDRESFSNLEETGLGARQLLLDATFPQNLQFAIVRAWKELGDPHDVEVIVTSNVIPGDLSTAGIPGQQERFQHINDEITLLTSVKKCFASLYSDSAIRYREHNGFAHMKMAVTVSVVKMMRTNEVPGNIGFIQKPIPAFGDIVTVNDNRKLRQVY